MALWKRLALALLIGAAVGLVAALVSQALGFGREVFGGAAGAIAAGVTVILLKPRVAD
jgi:hypothetical protein